MIAAAAAAAAKSTFVLGPIVAEVADAVVAAPVVVDPLEFAAVAAVAVAVAAAAAVDP